MGITAVASMAVVADDSGWYVGGNVGESRATIDEAKIVDGLKDSGFTTTSITDDDRHFGFKVFGGYQFDRFLAVEGGYFDLGQFGFTADTLPAGSYRGNIKLDGANLDLVGTLPFTDRFGAFARVGVEYAYARDSFAGSGMVVVPVSGRWEQATNAKFGFGLQYAFTPSLAMRLEAERYRIDDPVEHGADMDLYSIGLLYRFGARARAPAIAVVSAPPPPPPPPPPPAAPAPAPVVALVPILVPSQQYCSILDIQFDINRYDIQRQDKEKLREVGTFLNKYTDTTAVIEGHSDNVGTPEHNITLSQERAQSVVSYLESNFQIAPSRLTAIGYGDTRPRADNATEAGKRLNRRIDAVIACVSDTAGLAVVRARFTVALVIDFEQNQAQIAPTYRDDLLKLANFLKANPSVTATVEGHSGNLQATPELGLEVSRQRAQSVVDYLTGQLGVNPSQVSSRAFGKTRRFAYSTSAEGRQENRRVEIVLNYPN
jgi:OOP family OmpA-OmpF porin